MEHSSGQLYGSIQTAKKVGISIRQLYHWVDTLEVVNPKLWQFGLRQFRRFTPEDLKTLGRVKELLERGYTLRAAVEIVKGQRIP